MDRQCKKNNKQFTYGQTVQKTALEHLQCSRQCKKNNNSNLHMDRQCKKKQQQQFTYGQTVQKKQQQFTYGQTVQKKQQQFTYGQYIFTDCTEDNVQNTHTCYSVRLVYYRDILNYQRHFIHRMGTSTLCTVSIHNVVYT